MKGNELREEQIGIVHPTAPSTTAKAKWAVATRAADEKWTRAEIEQVLEMLGMRPYSVPAKTNPTTGQTEYAPTADVKAKAADRKRVWRQQRKEAS